MQTTLQKLAILADAAKYDASCASSGTDKKSSLKSKGIGSTEGMGICHAYAPDGRCISLLKILLTNYCRFDCHYCVNRASSNVQRARFTVDEVVDLTLGFYKRNFIEGLFLSSGIIQSPDYTMEQVVAVARKLRLEHEVLAATSTSRRSPMPIPRCSRRPAAGPTGSPSTSSCRRRKASSASRRRRTRTHPPGDGRAAAPHRGCQGRAQGKPPGRKTAALRAGRPVDADDHRRGRRRRRQDPAHQFLALLAPTS